MPEKQKARGWKEIQAVIAAVSMVILMAICNVIASFERREDKGKTNSLFSFLPTPTHPSGILVGDPKLTATPTQVVTHTGSS